MRPIYDPATVETPVDPGDGLGHELAMAMDLTEALDILASCHLRDLMEDGAWSLSIGHLDLMCDGGTYGEAWCVVREHVVMNRRLPMRVFD